MCRVQSDRASVRRRTVSVPATAFERLHHSSLVTLPPLRRRLGRRCCGVFGWHNPVGNHHPIALRRAFGGYQLATRCSTMAEVQQAAPRRRLSGMDLLHDSAVVRLTHDDVNYEIILLKNKSVADCRENQALTSASTWSDDLPQEQNLANHLVRYRACRQLALDAVGLWAKPGKWEYTSWLQQPLYWEGAPRKQQLFTEGKELVAIPAETHPSSCLSPVPNVYDGVRVYTPDELTAVAVVCRHMFKVTDADGKAMLLKQVYHYEEAGQFTREIEVLRDLQPHSAIVGMCGVVSPSAGLIDGILLPFLSGRTLNTVESATKAQVEQWKEHIGAAIDYLHSQGKVWGDAKHANVMIDDEGRAILFDFDGRTTEGFVDQDNAMSVIGDKQGSAAIYEFLDGLSAQPPGAAAAPGDAA